MNRLHSPVFITLVSYILRIATVFIILFYIARLEQWFLLLFWLAGFILARIFLSRLLGRDNPGFIVRSKSLQPKNTDKE